MLPPTKDRSQDRPLPPQRKLPDDEPGMTYEQLLGSCENLWETDEEFEQFLQVVEASRKEKG